MLSYAFQVLRQSNYESIEKEEFNNAQDLFAAILIKGVSRQLKQGLYREYITFSDTLTVMRGKLNMPETVRCRIRREQKPVCEFDELSENNVFNRIIKTTIHYLLKDSGVKEERKKALKKLFIFFDETDLLQPSLIEWNRLNYRRGNANYEMLLNICYFIILP